MPTKDNLDAQLKNLKSLSYEQPSLRSLGGSFAMNQRTKGGVENKAVLKIDPKTEKFKHLAHQIFGSINSRKMTVEQMENYMDHTATVLLGLSITLKSYEVGYSGTRKTRFLNKIVFDTETYMLGETN